MVSKSILKSLPEIEEFTRLTKSLAALDAVVCPAWDYRYYSFDSKWSDEAEMASMRNGSGDRWFAHLSSAGVAIMGLAHEAPGFAAGHPAPWIFNILPEPFYDSFLHEPAFDASNSTYCLWHLTSGGVWTSGAVPSDSDDGSTEQLSILAGGPDAYLSFASTYHEVELHADSVRDIYSHVPLDAALAARLNPEVDFAALRADLLEIGYPAAG